MPHEKPKMILDSIILRKKMSCKHTFTFGPYLGDRCTLSAITEYCSAHSIHVPDWDPAVIRDFTSFLMSIMDPTTITLECVQKLVKTCGSDLQACAEAGWVTEDKDLLHEAVMAGLMIDGFYF